MEDFIFTLVLCGLIIANLVVSYKHHQKIDILDDKQEKARKDINELFIKPIVKKPKTKKPTTKKPLSKKPPQQRKSKTKKQILKG